MTENCAFQHLHLATFTPAAPTTLDVAALAAGAGGDASDRAVATAPAIAAATCAPPASATIVGVPTFARTVAASPPLEPPPAPPPRRAPTATSRTMPPPTLPVPEVVAPLQEGQVRPPGGGSTQSEKGQMIMKVLKLLLRRGDRRSCSRAPCSRARGNTTKAKNARKEGKKPAKGRKKKAKARRRETMNGKDLWDISNMVKDANVNGLKRERSKGKDGDDESHFSLKVTKFKTRGRTRAVTEKNMANMREPLEIDRSSGGDDGMSSDDENESNVSGCTTTAPNAKVVQVSPETVHSASCTSRHSGKDEGGEREVRPPRVLSCQDVFGDKEGQSVFDLDTEDEGLFDKKVTTFLREEKVMTFLMDVTDQGKGVGDDTRVQPCGGMIPGDEEATLCQEKATSTGEVSDQGKGVGDDTRAQPCHGMIPGDEGTTFYRFTRRKR